MRPSAPSRFATAASSVLALIGITLPGCGPSVQVASSADPDAYVLDHDVARIGGEPESLEAYRGSVVLLVNTASKCGYTSQYGPLQELYEQRKDQGLVVLGFPSNDFLGQEPGSNKDIAVFCSTNYGVEFPMFEKVRVKGAEAHPLFQELARHVGAPSWNFNKYLIDRNGRITARFDSGVTPNDDRLLSKLDELLAAEASSG